MKKIIALLLAMVMVFSLAACSKNDTSTENEAATTAPDQAAATQAPADEAQPTEAAAEQQPVTIKFSWWGGDSRHNATLAAVDKFMETYPYITVESQYGAWTDWETNMATAFATGTAPDVNQINWNWITAFSSDGSVFRDLNEYSDIIDLTQFSQAPLDQCTLAGKLQAVPVSMTGRIFYWNKSTFDKAGIATPKSFADLKAAGETFKTVLGDDCYPLALGEYDRTIFLVYYLESVYGKAWVVDGKLNYTADEIKTGLEFIQSMEADHIIPSIMTIDGDGADSLDKNPKWIDGRYAGILEWDSSASKFNDALAEGQEFIVGDYFADWGDYKGGFSKVSLAFAISETSANPKECAMLINFLLNEDAGVEIMAAERGIPLSQKALTYCTDKGLLNPLVAEANGKILSWVSFPLDPKFEAAELKNDPEGVYYDVFAGLSYGDYDVDEAVTVLMDGINSVLSK